MFQAQIQNVKGDILTLSGDEEAYQIIGITGLNPPKAQINLSTMAGLDGATFNSSKLETRNIVITIKLNGAAEFVEANRQKLYRYFPTKEWCKFFYKNAYRNVYIEGYVENLEVDLFQKGQTVQISIICPQPYFKAMNQIIDDISKVISAFKFPFAFGSVGATNPDVPILSGTDNAIPFSLIETNRITDVYNDSESQTGVIIQITTLDNVNVIQIQNTLTGDVFILNYSFIENDVITINTNKGAKSVTLLRNGVTYNIFAAIQVGSTFFQLEIGDNFFSYIADGGASDNSVNILFKHYTVYRGV